MYRSVTVCRRWANANVSRLRRTSTNNAFNTVGEDGQVSDSVDSEHVLSVRIAGDCRQFVAVKVRANADRHHADAGVSDQLGFKKSGRLAGRRVIRDDYDQLGHRWIVNTRTILRHENRVASERQGNVKVGLIAAVANFTDCRLHINGTAVVAKVEVHLRTMQHK